MTFAFWLFSSLKGFGALDPKPSMDGKAQGSYVRNTITRKSLGFSVSRFAALGCTA